MAQGITSKTYIVDEVSYGVFPGTAAMKRIEVKEDNITPDYGYSDPETITGSLTKSPNIRTKKTVEGSLGIVAAPENGFGRFLKYGCGTATTKAGYHWREHFTLAALDDTVTLAHFPVSTGSQRVWYYTKLTNTWRPLVLTTDYTIADATGVITLVTAAAVGDEVIVSYCEDVAGVNSHFITSSTGLPSFQFWDTKGGLDLFEYTGCKVNTLTISINAEDFLSASCDLMVQDEKLGSETMHTPPPGLLLSNLDPFIFKQSNVLVNHLADNTYESVEIGIDNAIDPVYTIRCDDTVKDLTPTIQTVTISCELELSNMLTYNKVRNGDFFFFAVEYGKCQGVPIGSTGRNYSFEFWAPRVRHESGEAPTVRERLKLTVEGFANYDSQFDMAYEMVLINSEASV